MQPSFNLENANASSLKAYYLQEMGIETWVRRRSLLPPSDSLTLIATDPSRIQVMILLEGSEIDTHRRWLAGKAGGLLKKMLHSIGLSPENTALLCGLTTVMTPERDALLEEQMKDLRPQLVLQLGSFETAYLSSPENTFPVFRTIHPKDLLTNPSLKKQVFSDLMMLKQHLD